MGSLTGCLDNVVYAQYVLALISDKKKELYSRVSRLWSTYPQLIKYI